MCCGTSRRLRLPSRSPHGQLTALCSSSLRHILGFSSSSSSELLGGPVIKKELQERLSQQMSFLHLIHWLVFKVSSS